MNIMNFYFTLYFFQSIKTNRSGKFLFDEIFGIDITGPGTSLDEEIQRNCTCGKIIHQFKGM